MIDLTSIIVEALKSPGPDLITDSVKESMRDWLNSSLKDTRTVTGWINQTIHDICSEKK
ncbi:MAG: hypothetical protein KAW14_09565 [Candidatus Aegiribacteria sp.]|nr:hypothetical protein [Candidatus Aegiribacteria sp.]